MSNEHLGGCYTEVPDANTYTPDVWEKLAAKYHINKIVDVGCGAAWNTAWWHSRGFYAIGVEGWPDAIAATKMPMERMIVHDYVTGPLVLPEPFDLATSTEFVEHVEEKYLPNYMATFQCCRYVLMTYATPGQTGYHHVNEQDFPYWEAKMNQYGFDHLPEDTKWMRATDQGGAWGRKTLCLFKNRKTL